MPKVRGQILIGLIISMGLLAVLSQAIVTLVFTSYDLLNFTASRTTARYIAQEKMENIRNLPYDSVGTLGGIPTGTLPQLENISRNGLNYEVRTSVIYIDDPFDNQTPTDTLPTDYKRVRVEVSWGGLANSARNPVVLVSDVAPKDIEQATGGGTLSIFVLDSNAEPLSGATALIEANTTPQINLSLNTGANGRIVLPGAPACASCYRITITKDGHSSERTYSTSEIATPDKPDQSIIEGSLTEISFVIDRVSTLNFASVGSRQSGFVALPGQAFRVRGEKIIGTDGNDDQVYKYDETITTNTSGVFVFSNLEWDTYHFTPIGSSYNISGTNPLLPITILPNTTTNSFISTTAQSTHNLLATFVDSGESPIASVTGQLKNSSGDYVATSSSGVATDPDFGQIFFPSVTPGSYTLEASASGFVNSITNINIVGNIAEMITLLNQ